MTHHRTPWVIALIALALAAPAIGQDRGGRDDRDRGRPSVVDDWRGHRLSAPPRGYHWVQVGADYVLVAIATGIILQLILDQ